MTTNDRAVAVPSERRDVLTQDELRRSQELDQLVSEQYADEASTRWIDASIDDILDGDIEAPPLLDIHTAWERENERYRQAGRRRSSR